MVYTFKKFRSYLMEDKVTVHTNHATFKYMFKKKRWQAKTN